MFIAALFVIARTTQSFSLVNGLTTSNISIPWNTTQR